MMVSGCISPQGVSATAAPGSSGTVTVTLTRTTAVPAQRTNISGAITQVHDYVTGAAWNSGRVPGPSTVVTVDHEAAQMTGRLTYSESAGAASYGRTQTVETRGVGNAATFEMTTRSSSADPGTVLDVLHRSGNARHDYLLTGDAYRAAAPTAWVTVPAQFGNGFGCALPGRQVVCQVTVDLLANQALDPSMPTNTSRTSNRTGWISSAITMRQLLALDIWRLRTAGAALARKVPASDLDRTLIPVTLSFDALPGSTVGRPEKLTINGTVAVGGVRIAIDLLWDEAGVRSAKEIDLPVPTKAVYTVLNAAQARQLAVMAGRSE